MRGTILPLILLLFSTLQAQEDPALPRLQAEIARIAKVSGGVVGATAIHVETGRRVALHADVRFPMASTVKVPIAVQLLSLVDEGKERLDRMIELRPQDLHPGSGTLSDLFRRPGVALSIRNLMELMLLISDNSATDVLLRTSGGGEAVNARLRSLGIDGIRVDRPTALLIADAVGLRLPPESEWSPEVFERAFRAVTAEQRRQARSDFNADPRDTSTPDGMADLLVRIHRKQILRPASAELLLDILRRCRTGQTRLKGLLPEGTVVAHKTGTILQSANDVGILTLPGDAGHVALAVFVKESEKPAADMDRGIAEIARAVHDYFLFNPRSGINVEHLAARIVAALQPARGERYYLRPDHGYFESLSPPLRNAFAVAGAVETKSLEDATIYVWLPLRPGGPGLPSEEREALKKWIDKGGARRQLHFHWGEGSVFADGLYGEHSPAFDVIYSDALDTAGLSERMDAAIARFRDGEIRVRTPAGTDIRFRTGNRPFSKQDGDASAGRATRAQMRIDRDIELPAGVLRVAPIEESVNGVIVVPEARFGPDTAKYIRLHFRRGRVVKIEAAEGLQVVERSLPEGPARRFREFALGFNLKLKAPSGSRVLPYYGYGDGVVRLSLGDNQELGGEVRGGFVRWLFFPDATVETAR